MIAAAENNLKSRIIVCAGFSCCLLVGIFTLWGGLHLSSLTGMEISDILKYWSVPFLLALGLMLLSVLLKKRRPSKNFLTIASLVSCALIVGALVFLFSAGSILRGNTPLVILLAACIGLGYGLLLLLWQHELSRFSDDGITKLLLLSLAFSSASYLLLMPLLEDVSIIVPLLTTLLSIALCIISIRLPWGHTEATATLPHKEGAFKSILLELRDPLFCVSAIAVAVALTRAIALDGIENAAMINVVASASIIIISLALYVIWFGFGEDHPLFGGQNILGLYRVFFPIIATALLLLSIVGSSLSLAVTTLVYAAFSIVSALTIPTSIAIARKLEVWSPYVYGIFAGGMYFVFMAATALGAWVYYPKNFGAATISVIVLLMLYVLAMSYVAVQNRKKKSLGEASGEDEPTPAPSHETTIVDEVTQRCSILTEENSLTAREKDVLLLIARGRDVPSISKQLFISENTVRSHSKSVYKKLNIHSRQELLDLLETTPLG